MVSDSHGPGSPDNRKDPGHALPADCGAQFEHDMHVFRTPRGKVKACDGSVTKRL